MRGCPESLTCHNQAAAQTLDYSRERSSVQLGSVLATVRPGISQPDCTGVHWEWHGAGPEFCLGQEGVAKQLRVWKDQGPRPPQPQGTRHSPLGLLNSYPLLYWNT